MTDREPEHPRELLSAWIDGEVTPEERAAVESHLAGCPACRDLAEDLRALSGAVASDEPPPVPEELPARVAWRIRGESAAARRGASRWLRVVPLTAAATLAAVALLVTVVVHQNSERGTQVTPAIQAPYPGPARVSPELEREAQEAAARKKQAQAPGAVASKRVALQKPALAEVRKDAGVAGLEEAKVAPEATSSEQNAVPAGKTGPPAAAATDHAPIATRYRSDRSELATAKPSAAEVAPEAQGGAVGGVLGGVENQESAAPPAAAYAPSPAASPAETRRARALAASGGTDLAEPSAKVIKGEGFRDLDVACGGSWSAMQPLSWRLAASERERAVGDLGTLVDGLGGRLSIPSGPGFPTVLTIGIPRDGWDELRTALKKRGIEGVALDAHAGERVACLRVEIRLED